ncbi:hypothetical protein CVT24_006626 [Panaeolus cyanescens]|uniref:Uncharacterized protein n=1 Tax=Panaeolus cyanescens TaxID=181874 RepID=A0A409YSA1_9AGAR|nr:hypothetical protein CVT24_006626 [Panaeolus cyanescens]
MDQWPEHLRIPKTTTLIPAIPKLHEPMHQATNHQVFSLNFISGVGLSDLETPERVWGPHNNFGNGTKTQGPGSRQDTLDDHFGFWNWLKFIGIVEGHRGFSESLDHELLASFETICADWEADAFPKKVKNPYETERTDITEAEARKALALQEEELLKSGAAPVHETSASSFITMGLDIEESQRRLRRFAKDALAQATARQEAGLTEQRNGLRHRIKA